MEQGKVVFKFDPMYYRPSEVGLLIGDPSKANKILGWKHNYNLAALVKEMVSSNLELYRNKIKNK